MASAVAPQLRLDTAKNTRCTLLKRTVERSGFAEFYPAITTFDSADLSNLFADVERVHNDSSRAEIDVIPSCVDDDTQSPPKKRKITLYHSVSQDNLCGYSERSNKGTKAFGLKESAEVTTDDSIVCRPNEDIPATVSRSFSAENMLESSWQKAAHEENQDGDFGWFLDIDDGEERAIADAYKNPLASDNLAFSAQVAPKAADYHDEVEWAKAADTVDEVLCDFF